MLNKGILEEVEGILRVRVLENNGEKGQSGSSLGKDLPKALFAITAGQRGQYKNGDAVIVGYEKDDINKPIVLGLFTDVDRGLEYNASALQVASKAILPKDTTIGKVTPKEIATLEGSTENIPQTLTEIKKQIKQNKNEQIKYVQIEGIGTVSTAGIYKIKVPSQPKGYILISSQCFLIGLNGDISFVDSSLTNIKKDAYDNYEINILSDIASSKIRIIECYIKQQTGQKLNSAVVKS